MAVCISREFGWMMPVTTPAWLRTLSGPPTTPPLSTFTVANIRTHKISTQTSACYPPTYQTPFRFSIEISSNGNWRNWRNANNRNQAWADIIKHTWAVSALMSLNIISLNVSFPLWRLLCSGTGISNPGAAEGIVDFEAKCVREWNVFSISTKISCW